MRGDEGHKGEEAGRKNRNKEGGRGGRDEEGSVDGMGGGIVERDEVGQFG